MYKLQASVVAVALIMFIGTGCKKNEGRDVTDVTFTNQIGEKVTLDIYASQKDYENNSNLMLRKVLAPKENTILPVSSFAAGTTYYMDWYTDDYFYNNWFSEKYPVINSSRITFKPEPGDNSYYMKAQSAGSARKAFLPGGASSSRWTAINIFAYSKNTGYVSYWQYLSPQSRYREIIVNKNFSAICSRQDTVNNKIVKDTVEFMVHSAVEAYIELKDKSSGSAGFLVSGKLPASDGTEHASTATDSVLAMFPDSDLYFLMVRQ